MALHERCVAATDEWYTPPYIFVGDGSAIRCGRGEPVSANQMGRGLVSSEKAPAPIMMLARRDTRHHDHLYYSPPSGEATY
jgi:hypothetical protein